jgi:hypothetical protein
MRIWEIEDNKALPTDLVLEQDFILRVRRLQRHGTPHLVINLALNAIETLVKSRRSLEAVHERLQEFAKITNGIYAEMSNGDVFIIWEETADAHLLSSRIVTAILPEGTHVEDTGSFLLTYHTPLDYTALRERANHYVELVQTAATMGNEGTAAQILRSDAARGPLTAWSADQIGRLLADIDLRRYGRTQIIYQYEADDKWTPLAEEYFVSFNDLRRERFPRLDIITPEHLFLALCEILDARLLTTLTEHPETIAGRTVMLNLSVGTIATPIFSHFGHTIPMNRRGMVGFELHRGDLLQDFNLTLSSIEGLRTEGFRVALDAITPDMVNYLNLAAFNTDFIKINVSKERVEKLLDPAIRRGLGLIPPERIIFFRCDNEDALRLGREIGISKFQGWLIDDAVLKRS